MNALANELLDIKPCIIFKDRRNDGFSIFFSNEIKKFVVFIPKKRTVKYKTFLNTDAITPYIYERVSLNGKNFQFSYPTTWSDSKKVRLCKTLSNWDDKYLKLLLLLLI